MVTIATPQRRGILSRKSLYLRCALLQNPTDWANQFRSSYHLLENQYNWKTISSMNMKVGDIIQYYAYKILDALDKALVANQCE